MFRLFRKKSPIEYPEVQSVNLDLAAQIIITTKQSADGFIELMKGVTKDANLGSEPGVHLQVAFEYFVFNLCLVYRAFFSEFKENERWSVDLFQDLCKKSVHELVRTDFFKLVDDGAERRLLLMVEKCINETSHLPYSSPGSSIVGNSLVGVNLTNCLGILGHNNSKDILINVLLLKNAMLSLNRRIEIYAGVSSIIRSKLTR